MERSDDIQKILRALGRIEGQLVGFNRLAERVRLLEIWQSWLRGAWAVLVGAWVYVCRK
jgi:hypothetical protein